MKFAQNEISRIEGQCIELSIQIKELDAQLEELKKMRGRGEKLSDVDKTNMNGIPTTIQELKVKKRALLDEKQRWLGIIKNSESRSNDPRDTNTNRFLCFYWESIKSAEPFDSVLSFPVSSSYVVDFPRYVLVRKCYVELFDQISKRVENDGTNNSAGNGFVITGIPGVGKSYFLFYALWKLSLTDKAEAVVIHRECDNPWIYVFTNQNCFQTTETDYASYHSYLEKESTWYVTDNLPTSPECVNAVTIVLTAPEKKRYRDFVKYSESTPLYYLPSWSLDELRSVKEIYKLSNEQICQLFYRYGGVASLVLENQSESEEKIVELIRKIDFDDISKIGQALTPENRYLVVHFTINPDYSCSKLHLASDLVIDTLLDIYEESNNSKLQKVMLSLELSDTVSPIRLNLFQGFAYRQLLKINTFKVCSLDSSDANPLDIQISLLRKEYYLDNYRSSKLDVLYTQPHHEYPSIDAVIPGFGLLKMMVPQQQEFIRGEIKNISLDAGLKRLYYVVPENYFDVFLKQTPLHSINCLEQFALCLALN